MYSLRNHLLVLSAGVLIALVAGELLLRLWPSATHNYRLEAFATEKSPAMMQVLNKPDCLPRFRPSPLLGYERIPLSEPRINSLGLVGPEYPPKKGPGTLRILVLGDSIAEYDWYVRTLETLLNDAAGPQQRYELWNAGTGGYEVQQYAQYLKHRGLAFRPDMVIIGLCLNDLSFSLTMVTYKDARGFKGYYYSGWRLPRMVPVNSLLFAHSYLYRFLYVSIDHLIVWLSPRGFGDERMDMGKAYLGDIKRLCLERGIALVAVVFPYLKAQEEYSRREQEEYSSMTYILDQLAIEYIDLHNVFPKDAAGLRRLRLQQEDYIHPGEEGHRLAAQAIYDYLTRTHFHHR